MEKQASERDDDVNSNSMDTISLLPQHILHHILSFLNQKEAVQTSVLSKSWRYLWLARPNIEFRETLFKGNKRTFLSVVDETLQRYHDHNLSIQEFTIEILKVNSESVSLLEKWIPIVIQNNNLRTFGLYFDLDNWEYFDVPSVVFEAETLQKLCLQGCRLNKDSSDKVLLKNLQTLSLNRVQIVQQNFLKILSSCPLIENLSLSRCKRLNNISLNEPPGFYTIAINGFHNTKSDIHPCLFNDHHNKYFPRLKSLILHKLSLPSESFDFFSSKHLPCLENLTLNSCYGFQEFYLYLSASVKNLVIMNMYKSTKATIDAPNIVKFVYEGQIPQSAIAFTTTSSNWQSNIILINSHSDFYNDPLSWFRKLNELLEVFNRSKISLELFQHRLEEKPPLFFKLGPDIILRRLYKPTVIENLSLRGYYSYSRVPSFLNCLFCICCPRYIGQYLYSNAETDWEKRDKELNDFLLEILLLKRELREGFWRQDDLQEVSLDGFEKNGQESCPTGIKVCFRLKWREY